MPFRLRLDWNYGREPWASLQGRRARLGTANGNRTRISALKGSRQKSKNLDLCGFLTIQKFPTCCNLLSFLVVFCPNGARLVQVFRSAWKFRETQNVALD